jgi:hypothetical protein
MKFHVGRSRPQDPLETALRDLGYDVEPPQSGDPRSRGLVARRDLGDRAVLLAIDAGGRFRIEITWVDDERSGEDEVAAVPVRVVDTTTRALTIAGQIEDRARIVDVLTALGSLAGAANAVQSQRPQPNPAADDNESPIPY